MVNAGENPGEGARVPLLPDEDGIVVQACKGGRRLQARKVGEEKFGAAAKKIFLENLRRTANVTRSAKAAGIAPNTAYRHRARNINFDIAWTEALMHAIDVLETMLLERALRYNASLSDVEGEQDGADGAEAVRVEPFSNGDAMRLVKAHRESLDRHYLALQARVHARPDAVEGRMLEKLHEICDRLVAREQVLNDAPV